MQRLRLSGLMPMSVPVNFFPVVVKTLTVLSTNAATSVRNFLCATDNFKPSLIKYEIALQLFIFNMESVESWGWVLGLLDGCFQERFWWLTVVRFLSIAPLI